MSVGRFYRTANYMLGYMLASACANEPQLIAQAIAPDNESSSGRRLLEIGPADGRITRIISRYFDHVHFFEPQPVFHTLSCLAMDAVGGHYRSENAEFSPERVDEFQDRFHVILLSHVLYHVPEQHWVRWFSAFRSILAPAGTVRVILWSEDSEAFRMTNSLSPQRWPLTAERFLEAANHKDFHERTGLKVTEVMDLKPQIRAGNEASAKLILDFFLGHRTAVAIDAGQSRAIAELMNGINNNQKLITLAGL